MFSTLEKLTINPLAVTGCKRYVFVMGHMRSYSSLLCHILGSHAAIDGYAEMHQSYGSALDLIKLRCKVYLSNGRNLRGRYVLDKILHNRYVLSDTLLSRRNIYLLVLVRPPLETITSIVAMALRLSREEWATPERAADYYIQRLENLCRISVGLDRTFLVDARAVIESTDTLLSKLDRVLGLATPLQASYERFRFTGTPVRGDFSDNLLAGRVVQGKSLADRVEIPAPLLEKANLAYQIAMDRLTATCSVLG